MSDYWPFEHLTDPIAMLQFIRERLVPGGLLFIEVPHARDFLISTLDCAAFKDFTFWSEHLILHTRQSLELFLSHAGFGRVVIEGFQRYPISNHLYWLARGRSGGHKKWESLNDNNLAEAYADTRARIDQTDTLIARAAV